MGSSIGTKTNKVGNTNLPESINYIVMCSLVIIGVVVGAFGSFRAVRKYLKVWKVSLLKLYFQTEEIDFESIYQVIFKIQQ